MPEIHTLISDIKNILDTGRVAQDEHMEVFKQHVADSVTKQLGSAITDKERPERTLYATEVGEKCMRKLWYRYNASGEGLPLPSNVRVKFTYGDLIEGLILYLAREAGHEVTDEQKSVVYSPPWMKGWTVRGRLDAKIDGVTVDVKSTSKYGYQKFQRGLKKSQDAFNYIEQIGHYSMCEGGDSAFLAIEKENGNIHLDMHDEGELHAQYLRATGRDFDVLLEDLPPVRYYRSVPDNKTSKTHNKLGIECSYCDFREKCWPGVSTIFKSSRPVYIVDKDV